MTHIIMSHGVIPRYNSDLYHMMSDDIQFIPIYTNWRQGCKMNCEKLRICEIANCDCEKIAISQLTQFTFLSVGRNRNITQFDFLEGRNCEIAKNCEIGQKNIFVSRIQPILEIY
jgi:hypothetical protein